MFFLRPLVTVLSRRLHYEQVDAWRRAVKAAVAEATPFASKFPWDNPGDTVVGWAKARATKWASVSIT